MNILELIEDNLIRSSIRISRNMNAVNDKGTERPSAAQRTEYKLLKHRLKEIDHAKASLFEDRFSPFLL